MQRLMTRKDFYPVYRITSISITNRIHHAYRINGAKILIGNSQENDGYDNPVCAVIQSIPSGATSTFDCGGMVGRFVYVYLIGQVPLTMCEVEVFGQLAAPWPSYSAVVKGRDIVVVEKKLCWSDALFYCRDFYWDLLSIHSEEEQREVEEVLRSISFPLNKHVWLGLRRYVMGSKWFWMTGTSMDYSNLVTKSIWQNTSPCGGIGTSDHFHWTDLPCGDHIQFICLTEYQTDDKRVMFFSSKRP
ncbi:snaclec 1-like [Centropristis striata]|uniref:snaclec 1-like n=1 Tax=Centropristis striata TaxID=184440 RepID=UPI0027E0D527|nr:snaclec 1-like [Centropristis striata]